MIDGDGDQPPTGALRPVRGDMQKGKGVPAARQGDGERMIDADLKSGVQTRRDPAFQPGRVVAAQRQPARVRVSAAMARSAGVEVAS